MVVSGHTGLPLPAVFPDFLSYYLGASRMKTKMYWRLLGAGLACAVIAPIAAAAGDAEAGKTKFYSCAGCHTLPGYTNAYPSYNVPLLGGQHADYLVASLEGYQNKERQHGKHQGSMYGNSVSLSEADMQDIAAYLAKFKDADVSMNITGNPAAGKEKTAACAACHGEDGNSSMPMFPRLAGQYESYIVKALEDYKSGVRTNPMMTGPAKSLSAEDIKNIAAYYASQKKGLALPPTNH